ncbi:MAG: SlyX family protein [Woeseiaceae bacterium]
MTYDRIEKIEEKLAHQEHLLIELNDALAKQQESIMTLEQLCAAITERISAMGDPEGGGRPKDERPPHY